ncbi:MAG: hypothetical protein ACREFR_05500, partial [Limisphaerales bacterium]
ANAMLAIRTITNGFIQNQKSQSGTGFPHPTVLASVEKDKSNPAAFRRPLTKLFELYSLVPSSGRDV